MVVHQPGDTLTCALELVQHRLPDVRPHHGRLHLTGFPLRLFVRIPDTKRFRKEADGTGRTVFRSTLLAPDRRMLAGSGIPELTREIATILKLEGYEETAE